MWAWCPSRSKRTSGVGCQGGHVCGESVIEVAVVLEHTDVGGVWSERLNKNHDVMVGSKGIFVECGCIQRFKKSMTL